MSDQHFGYPVVPFLQHELRVTATRVSAAKSVNLSCDKDLLFLADHFAISVTQLYSCLGSAASSHNSPFVTTMSLGAASTDGRYIGRRCSYKEGICS